MSSVVPKTSGLGIQNLEAKNTAHLSICPFKLVTEDGVWQTIPRRKYIGSSMSPILFGSQESAGVMASNKPSFSMDLS